jgi:hypothetical protein
MVGRCYAPYLLTLLGKPEGFFLLDVYSNNKMVGEQKVAKFPFQTPKGKPEGFFKLFFFLYFYFLIEVAFI